MSMTLRAVLLVGMLAVAGAPVQAQSTEPPTLISAVARAAEAHSPSLQPVNSANADEHRRAVRERRRRRAAITGFWIGSVVGAACVHATKGSEAAFVGFYVGGAAGTILGVAAAR